MPASSPSALDPLKPLAQVDFAGQRATPFKHWAAAAKALDEQARQADRDADWEHVWVWSRKAAAITNHLANDHPDRAKPDNRELIKPLLRLVTSEPFKTRIKTAEALLLSRSSAASHASPPLSVSSASATGHPSSSGPMSSPSPEPSAPLSIKERMAALRGAGLNTGGDEPVGGGSSAGKRGSVQFGSPKPPAPTSLPPSAMGGASNGAMAKEGSGESRSSSGRGRKRDASDVVERLEKLAMEQPPPAGSSPSAAAVDPPHSPAQAVSPDPVPPALPSSIPLQPTQAPPQPQVPSAAELSQPSQPDIAISSPSPAQPTPEAAPAPPPSPPLPPAAPPAEPTRSAVPLRVSHGYSASVPSARSGSPSRPPKPASLSTFSSPTAAAAARDTSLEPSTSAPPSETPSPVALSPLRSRTPAIAENDPDTDDFSPSKFGHFPSITEFESSSVSGANGAGDEVDEPAPSFPSLPSVPLSLPGLPGSAPTSTRALPNPPASTPTAGGFQALAKAQTTGSSVSSFQSAHSAPASSAPSAPPQPSSAAYDQSGKSAVDFPLANTIFPALLRHYLTVPVELLLLDVRPPQTWSTRITPTSTGGGQVDCVCVPAHLLASPSTLTSQQLADGLPRTSPFHNRHLYDLVVVYDTSSAGWSSPGADGARAVNRAVYEREFGGKMLKRAPVLLVGGWEAWRAAEEGGQPAAGKQGAPPPMLSPGLNGAGSINGSREPSPAAKPSYFPLIPPIASPQGPRPSSSSPVTTNGPTFPSPSDMPARPSSTAAAAAPAPYNHSAPMTVPPAPASLAYPSSRRRSEYVDQTSAYTGYPGSYGSPSSLQLNGAGVGPPGTTPQRGQSIDYPTLTPSIGSGGGQDQHRPLPPAPHRKSSMSISHPPSSVASSLPQPPPVAATPPLERNASRGALVRSGSLSFPTLSEEGKLVQSSGNEVTYWGDDIVGLSGLKNLGNTCYQNSTLQCLSATEPFSTFFRDGRWKRSVNFNNNLGTKGNLASAYSSLISALWQQEYHFIQPLSFRKSIVKFAPTFDGVDQHDSQEFLAFLLDGLHEDLNRVLIRPEPVPMTPAREAELNTLPTQIAGDKEWQIYKKRNDSLVVDLFQGQYKSRMECLTCHQTSTTFDAFMYLSLPVPTSRIKHKVSLEHCLDTFVKEEIMEKGNAWNCPKCKKARTASKSLTLSRLPPVLLIHLKRFSTKNGVFWDKAETLVEFPIKYLDLTKYLPPPLSATKDPVAEARYREDPRTQTPPYVYELYAVSNHSGSLTTGHYTAYVKSSQRHWKFCDDRTISEADEKDVMSKHAYILFYRRVPAKRSL